MHDPPILQDRSFRSVARVDTHAVRYRAGWDRPQWCAVQGGLGKVTAVCRHCGCYEVIEIDVRIRIQGISLLKHCGQKL